jgi:hypothetical protein
MLVFAALGLLWYPSLRLANDMDMVLAPYPAAAWVFGVAGYLMAWTFRRQIVQAASIQADIGLAFVLPCIPIAITGIVVVLGVAMFGHSFRDFPEALSPIVYFFITVERAWYVIFAMGLLTQVILKRLGRTAWPYLFDDN